jgi:hypothetical protein
LCGLTGSKPFDAVHHAPLHPVELRGPHGSREEQRAGDDKGETQDAARDEVRELGLLDDRL